MQKEKLVRTAIPVSGIVEKRLFDSKKLKLVEKAIEMGITDPEYISALEDLAAKEMFKANLLWKIVFKIFNVDIRIPFVFGRYTKEAISHNLVPTRGKQIIVDQTGGLATAPITAIALGSGNTAAAITDTALETEITTNGGGRGAATVSRQTTNVTNDTLQLQKTFTFTGALSITEEGLFDNNTSGGNMLARQVFASIGVTDGDSLQITHKMIVTSS